jgi:type IV pilus assembly protein PilB
MSAEASRTPAASSAPPPSGARLLGQILIEMKRITPEQLQEALETQKQTGELLGSILVEMDAIREEDVAFALGTQEGLETVDLENLEIPPEVIDKVDATMAKMYQVVPIRFENNTLTLAMANAQNVSAVDDLKFMVNCDIVAAVSNPAAVSQAIEKYYGNRSESIEDLMEELEGVEEVTEVHQAEGSATFSLDAIEQQAESAPVLKLVNLYLLQAIKAQASDIHLEPFEDDFKVRYRIDGALYEMMPPPRQLAPALAARIKVMANMDISETRLPQDNRIELSIGGKPIDLRVSTLPTKFGESIVMRVLDRSVVALDLEQIGMRESEFALFKQLIEKPNGIVLVTGPTGSGKTTTLYSALNHLNDMATKLITTEDPVEYDLDGIVQVQVNPEIGVTFASCLRSILRQDPDTILVGEIRDLETAQIAIQSSLTGHLVLSTLHTNDAPQTITRLVDMGVEPFLVSATLEAIVAQRLVRKICTPCKTDYTPTAEILSELNLTDQSIEGKKFYVGRGCENCNNTGYKGRFAVFEIMVIEDRIRDLVTKNAPTGELRDVARSLGMNTLRESGMLAVYDGTTSIEEVLKVTSLID